MDTAGDLAVEASVPPPPPVVGAGAASSGASGALRIYSRRGGAEIRLISGDDCAPDEDEGAALDHIVWLKAREHAGDVARRCAERLTEAKMPADENGWHRLPVAHFANLLAVVRNNLAYGYEVERRQAVRERTRRPWTRHRIARLCVLIGEGWDAKTIADDPLVNSTPAMVHRMASDLGASLRATPQGIIHLRLPTATTAAIDKMAAAAGQTRDAYMRRKVIAYVEARRTADRDRAA